MTMRDPMNSMKTEMTEAKTGMLIVKDNRN